MKALIIDYKNSITGALLMSVPHSLAVRQRPIFSVPHARKT